MRHDLKKVLGLSFNTAVVIGGTIGVGILRTPGEIAALIPNNWLIILCWIAGGAYILVAASSYAELTAMLPKAGGAYNYVKRAFGGYAGFISGWFDYIVNAIAPAYFCIVLSEYFSLLFPTLHAHQTLIALGFLTLFTLVHIPGVKSGSVLQQVSSAIKILLFLILIVACFVWGDNQFIRPEIKDGQNSLIAGGLIIAVFRSFQMIIGAYDGWMSVSFFAEENSNPGKSIPRSYFLGIISVIVIYVLINIAILYVSPVSAISKSSLAVADVAGIIFGKTGSGFITFFAIFSLISILNAYMMIPARILFGLSRDGFFFRHAAMVNKGGTPVAALLISALIGAFLILASSFDQLFSLGAFMTVAVSTMAYASLLRLRKTEPLLPRPYLAWGYPFSTWFSLITSIGLLIGFGVSDTHSLTVIAGVVLASFFLYRFAVRSREG